MPSAIRTARVLSLTRRTLSCPTAPFREGAVITWLIEFAAAHPGVALRVDADGNVELRRRGLRPQPSPLVLVAHMDHPGFHVLRAQPLRRGWRIEARFLGGVRREFFRGARARFFLREGEVTARVRSARPERGSGDLRVLLDAPRRVPAGSFGSFDFPAFRRSRRDPDLLETRAADDLAGVAAVLALFDAVERIDPRRRVDVRGLFTRGEEVGFVGALAAARGGRVPRGARVISLEASKALPHAPQGGGPILRVGDRASVFDDGLTRWMGRVAARLAGPKGKGLRWQRRLMDGGTCEATAFQLHGLRCGALCLPLGNYHNMREDGRIGIESIRLSDLVGLVRLLEGLVRHDGDAPRLGGRDPLRARLDATWKRRRAALAQDPFA